MFGTLCGSQHNILHKYNYLGTNLFQFTTHILLVFTSGKVYIFRLFNENKSKKLFSKCFLFVCSDFSSRYQALFLLAKLLLIYNF